jgi:DNA transposition AAA+ family ATPase
MKQNFAVTGNVKRFVSAVDAVVKAPPRIDRMALVYGPPGLGKTETALWWWNQNMGSGAVYVRTKKLMTGRWLLQDLVKELGEAPAHLTKDLFQQAQDILLNTDRVVILDEVDYLTHDARVIETLRDLHDICRSPFIFIGMDQADAKLKRYRHLWRRFSQVVRFDHLSREDVRGVMNQICEVELTDDVAAHICNAYPNGITVANLNRWALAIEAKARRQGISKVSAAVLEAPKETGDGRG